MNKEVRNTLIVLCVAAVSCVMTGCLDNVKSDYTPEIYLSGLYLNPYYIGDTLHARDTLAFYRLENTIHTDTIQAGDTLMVGTTFYAVGNMLTAVRVSWDTAAVKAWFGLNKGIINALTDTTQMSKGYLPFAPKYNIVSFPVYFTPTKAGSHSIEMTIETDSKYSPVSLPFNLEVR